MIIAANKDNEIPKKSVIQIYKSLNSVNKKAIRSYLVQDFFFTDEQRTKYDLKKIIIFNLLYSGGKDGDKANFLFNLVST